MVTFKLINPAKCEALPPTKSFVKFVGNQALVIMEKDYGNEIKIHGEKSDAALTKINVESNIILNGTRQVTISGDSISDVYSEITLLFPIKDNTTYFSEATVYGINKSALSDAIGEDNLFCLEIGKLKLAENNIQFDISFECKSPYQTKSGEPANFVIVNKLNCKVPLLSKIQMYCIPCNFVMITDKDYGETIIISKDSNHKIILNKMNPAFVTTINNYKKITVAYFSDNNVMKEKSFNVPADYSEPTAYIVSLEEFISTVGRNYFYQLGYDLLGFALYDSKYTKTYSMNFEATNKFCQDKINISYKIGTPIRSITVEQYTVAQIRNSKTTFDNIDILKDNMRSFIRETKNKYDISYSEWNCKLYIKSYSYYDGKCTVEEEHDLNSEAFLETVYF